jgi:hypothetical protein
MSRAENKARLARSAVAVLAREAAKRAVKRAIHAAGERIWDFSAKDIALRADALLKEHPEMIAEARAKAAMLGFGCD